MKKKKQSKTIESVLTIEPAAADSKRPFAILVAIAILLVGVCLFAQSPESVPSNPADVPAVGAGFLDGLKALTGFEAPEWLLLIIATVVEFCGRVFKTKKPWSLLYFARDFLVLLASLIGSVSRALDKVLQKTKDSTPSNETKKAG